ncbi:MAG: phospho-N-acetylmuramoyl-pentapeptide-transferase, partial [Bacteroidaceae bacterium]|nr:phospho-N-acetylmuramoyl-pentapeptide-transferase [Bacteroidaceae bacterium]
MLYYLFQYLNELSIPGSRMWSYTSFRALLALMFALIISAWFGGHFIKWMRRHHFSETQRDATIDPFGVNKVGVPTMGGIIIIVATLVPCFLVGKLLNTYLILMIVTTLWLGTVGFLDDWIKMKRTKEGLSGKYKVFAQVSLGLIVGLTLYLSPDTVIRENITKEVGPNNTVIVHKSEPVKSTVTT